MSIYRWLVDQVARWSWTRSQRQFVDGAHLVRKRHQLDPHLRQRLAQYDADAGGLDGSVQRVRDATREPDAAAD